MLLFLFNACQYKKESLVFSVIIIKAEGVAHWHTKLHYTSKDHFITFCVPDLTFIRLLVCLAQSKIHITS